jgi:hypothetical protein
MAASNLGSNLHVFADLLNETYVCLMEIDKKSCGKNPPVYTQVRELQGIGRLLSWQ